MWSSGLRKDGADVRPSVLGRRKFKFGIPQMSWVCVTYFKILNRKINI